MPKHFYNLFLALFALSLCRLLAGESHAQALPVAASVDYSFGSGPSAPVNFRAGPNAALDASSSISPLDVTPEPPIEPVVSNSRPQPGVDWTGLTKDSLTFLAVMQGFRCATEPGTRQAFSKPFFTGYIRAVQNLHG